MIINLDHEYNEDDNHLIRTKPWAAFCEGWVENQQISQTSTTFWPCVDYLEKNLITHPKVIFIFTWQGRNVRGLNLVRPASPTLLPCSQPILNPIIKREFIQQCLVNHAYKEQHVNVKSTPSKCDQRKYHVLGFICFNPKHRPWLLTF